MVLVIWLYLLAARGGFWQAADREEGGPAGNPPWPAISAVIPARDEAECIGETVTSLLRQDYPGAFDIIVVDDQSRDGTAQVAQKAAEAIGAGDRITVISGRALPGGWTGKLWAQHQGVEFANGKPQPPDFVLFTDADIVYTPDVLTSLVGRAQAGGYVLTSLMVKLRCVSFAERLFIPAFIFFFQMLYPFAWANNPRRATAAAAGGCMLVRRGVLNDAGGMASIRTALIDDCALAKILKAHGPIWIGLTDRVHSIRAYPSIGDIRRMVSRTAYAQLRYSPLLLAGTVLGLAITYLAPVALTLFATGTGAIPRPVHLAADGLRVSADASLLWPVRAVGSGAAGDCGDLYGLHAGFRLSACPRARRHVERPCPSQRVGCQRVDANVSELR